MILERDIEPYLAFLNQTLVIEVGHGEEARMITGELSSIIVRNPQVGRGDGELELNFKDQPPLRIHQSLMSSAFFNVLR